MTSCIRIVDFLPFGFSFIKEKWELRRKNKPQKSSLETWCQSSFNGVICGWCKLKECRVTDDCELSLHRNIFLSFLLPIFKFCCPLSASNLCFCSITSIYGLHDSIDVKTNDSLIIWESLFKISQQSSLEGILLLACAAEICLRNGNLKIRAKRDQETLVLIYCWPREVTSRLSDWKLPRVQHVVCFCLRSMIRWRCCTSNHCHCTN